MAKYEQELYYHARDKSDSKPLVAAVFPIVEALSFMFGAPSSDESAWLQIDDGEDVDNICRIMGCMFLHFVRELDAHNPKLLDPEKTPIKNLGLVLGNMCCLADLWTGMLGYDGNVVGWKKEIMQIAEKHGVKLKQITKTVVDYDEKDEEEDNDMDEEGEGDGGDKWDFFSQVSHHCKSLGGRL